MSDSIADTDPRPALPTGGDPVQPSVASKTSKVHIEGQVLDLPTEVTASDQQIRNALGKFFPDIGNCEITRSTVKGQPQIHVTKRAGSKGALSHRPGGANDE